MAYIDDFGCEYSDNKKEFVRCPENYKGHYTIQEGVTSIGDCAFRGCSSLNSVTIPSSVMSIGGDAFAGCSGLASVTIPNSVTSIGGDAFAGCSGLTSVTIPNSVTSIGSFAFSGCSGLTSITIPNSVTSIGYGAFYNVLNIVYSGIATGSTGSPWGARSVNGYVEGYLVYESEAKTQLLTCSSAATGEIIIPNSVTSIGGSAFRGCRGLTSVVWNAKNFADFAEYYDEYDNKYHYGPFCNIASQITSFTFGSEVEHIPAYLCSGMENLTSVTIPNSVTSIGYRAFYGCSGLTSVTIPNSVTSIGKEAFDGTAWFDNQSDGVIYINQMLYTYKGEMPANTSIVVRDGTTQICGSAFEGCSGLTSVTIPNSVTSIGGSAFRGCRGLTSVTIPNSVTSIGRSAFKGTAWLANQPDGVIYINQMLYTYKGEMPVNTSIVVRDGTTQICGYAFWNCRGLTSVTIPNSVTSIGEYAFAGDGLFGGFSGLTSVTIPNSVTSIGDYAFYECRGLTSVTIGNSVTSIGDGAFSGCSGLTSVTIPNSVTSIGGSAFFYCSGLTSVTIGNSVTSIGHGVFAYCIGLTKTNYTGDIAGWCGINFGDWDSNPTAYSHNLYINGVEVKDLVIPDGVTSIGGWAFYKCRGLTSVTIPNSVTSIGGSAFYDCSGLTSVTIGSSVTSIGDGAFSDCRGLTKTNYTGDIAGWCGINFGDWDSNPTAYSHNLYINGVEVKDLVIPDGVTSIGGSAFYDCSGLTSVTIGSSVTSIGDGAFSDCCGLTSVTIPNSVTSIGSSAFYYCSGLTSVTIGNSVTSIGKNAYNGCRSLISVTIPNSVTSIGDHAFGNCRGLTSITIPNSVTSIGYQAFLGCSGLTSVVWNAKNFADFSSRDYAPFYNIKSQITSFTFGSEVKHIPAYLCDGMENLTSVTIPNSVTSIGSSAFYGCRGLTKTNYTGDIAGWCGINFGFGRANPTAYSYNLYINDVEVKDLVIPNSITSIGNYAFSGCSGLTSITIPNSITSIGNYAFSGCSGLTSITIPNSITSIGDGAFSGCCGLTSITIPNSVTSIGDCAFRGCSSLTSVTIPNNVTSIGDRAFSSCRGLTSVTIPNSVTSIGSYAFYGCRGLTSVTIPNSVTSIGYEAFDGCSGLTSVVWNAKNCADFRGSGYAPFYDINSQITSFTFGSEVEHIPAYLCYGMKKLTSVTIGNSVTSIGNGAFEECRGLTKTNYTGDIAGWCVIKFGDIFSQPLFYSNNLFINDVEVKDLVIPDGVTSIGELTFVYCSGLTSVTIPNSVTSIGEYAFDECDALQTIFVPLGQKARFAAMGLPAAKIVESTE